MKSSYFLPFVLLLTAPLLVQSSTNSEAKYLELLDALKIQLDEFQVKMDYLEAKNTENEAKNAVNEEKIAVQEEKIIKLEAKSGIKLKDSDENRIEDRRYLPSSKIHNMSLISLPENSRAGRAAVGPSSCSDLSRTGYSLNGFYLVRNTQNNMIQTVFCNFGTSGFQQTIGNVDIKTKRIHFYVQRNSSFGQIHSVIPFELARLNEGGAMNVPSGIFTAPVAGIYHFEFSGVQHYSSAFLYIYLQRNGYLVGGAIIDKPTTGSLAYVVSLSASIRLAAYDTVNLWNHGSGILFDDLNHYTHFSGWLVEEEI